MIREDGLQIKVNVMTPKVEGCGIFYSDESGLIKEQKICLMKNAITVTIHVESSIVNEKLVEITATPGDHNACADVMTTTTPKPTETQRTSTPSTMSTPPPTTNISIPAAKTKKS